MKITAIAFDLNGTLLDMAALDCHFAKIFQTTGYREKWFDQLQELWMTTIACNHFRPFDTLAEAALEMLAERESIKLEPAIKRAALAQMKELPCYPDVPATLKLLREKGYRIVALTNGAHTTAKKQLQFAQLGEYVENIFSADQVKRFKPAPELYSKSVSRLGLKPQQVLLTAAHAWDIIGAHNAGLQAAFIARPRQVLNPKAPRPEFHVSDLEELVQQLI